jgi:hypothetical protein
MTLEFLIGSINRKEGYVYSQFYSEAQLPFRVAGVYPFENAGYENLALDPTFVETVEYASRNVTFDPKTCERGFLSSKNRANRTTHNAQYKSYGTREEHCISLKLFNAI